MVDMRSIAVVALCLGAGTAGQAQTLSTAASPPSAQQCLAAIDTLRVGDLANAAAQASALSVIGGCGLNGAQAHAEALLRRRNSPVSADMHVAFTSLRGDSALLRTALAIATDGSASTAARALSLRLVLGYTDSTTLGYSELTATGSGQSCITGNKRDVAPGTLPANAADLIRQQARALESNPTQPLQVRSAANCVMNAWRMKNQLPVQDLSDFNPASVTFVYICGNQFRIGGLSHPLTLQYEIGGSGSRKSLLASAPETIIDVGVDGSVTLFFDDEVIATAANGHAECTGSRTDFV